MTILAWRPARFTRDNKTFYADGTRGRYTVRPTTIMEGPTNEFTTLLGATVISAHSSTAEAAQAQAQAHEDAE